MESPHNFLFPLKLFLDIARQSINIFLPDASSKKFDPVTVLVPPKNDSFINSPLAI